MFGENGIERGMDDSITRPPLSPLRASCKDKITKELRASCQ